MPEDSAAAEEAERRVAEAMPACRCGRWQTFVGHYDADGRTVRCHGCLRAIWNCTC
jgi:hypothetical protein